MAAYAQFGYGYPSGTQLLGGGGGAGAVQSTAATGMPPAPVSSATVPSPLSGANEASLSPSGGSTTTGVTTGPLSPGAISQTSNNAGSGAATAVDGAAGEGTAVATTGGTSCCENGRPIMTDPVSGQSVCSCQYDSARIALSSYSRMPAASVGVYGTPYPSTEQNPYPSIGVDSSAFYSPLSNPYTLKDSTTGSDMTAWTSAGLQPTTGYYSYDPALAAYGYGAGYDLAARRKNATRESTATLKAWLNEHKKNPYPTKGEKIMLAIITKMTLTQVSTWFANARRRLKKENKMTWEPKNKTEDDDDAMLSDDEKDGKDANELEKSESLYGTKEVGGDNRKEPHHLKTEHEKDEKHEDLNEEDHKPENLVAIRNLGAYNSPYSHTSYHPYQQPNHSSYYQHTGGYSANEPNEYGAPKNQLSRDCGIPIPATKPKIWSLADTVACKTPPPTAYLGQQYYSQHPLPQPQSQQLPHPQQQQPSLPPQLPHSNSSSNLNSNNIAQQHSQMELQQPQHQLPAAHNSPLNMMNNYVGGSPYSRIPTGYGSNVFGSSNSNHSSSSVGMPTTPTSPPTMSVHHQQQQAQQLHLQQYHHHHHHPQQQRMGFPEIQPDTPPQTPPNMKHSNSSGSGPVANPLLVGQVSAPTTTMCYTNGGLGTTAAINRSYGHEVSSGGNVNSNYVGVMSSSRGEA